MMKRTLLLAALVVLAGALSPARAQDQPASPGGTAAPRSTPPIYDESANAEARIAEALARAAKDNQRVLIQWGANWCGWCRLLHVLCTTNPEVKKKLSYEYDVVLVDVGRWSKNMELARRYGADPQTTGIPCLTVLSAEGQVVVNQETGSLEAKDAGQSSYDTGKVLEFLTRNQAPYLSAQGLLDAGLAKAKREGRRAFVHFGAPWCKWCHRLEAWMVDPAVAPVMAREFVDIKIDLDRTTGGEEILQRMSKGKGVGLPWFAFLDGNGEILADSYMPGYENMGCPADDREIAAFREALGRVVQHTTTQEIEAITAKLKRAAPN